MKNLTGVLVLFMAAALIGGCTKTTNTVTGSSSVGMTWTIRTAGVPSNFPGDGPSLVWGNNEFLLIGHDTTLTSADGKSWVAHASNFPYYFSQYSQTAVVKGASTFVAIDDSAIFSSADCFTWTKRFSTSQSGLYPGVSSITWGNNQFVAVGSNMDTCYAYISTNGVNWTAETLGIGIPLAVAWGNNRYVVIASGASFTSTDGIHWSQNFNNLFYGSQYSGIVYGANQFVAVIDGALFSSPEGINWTSLFYSNIINGITSIVWDGTRFVAAGSAVMTSTDGINWIAQPDLPTGVGIYQLAAGNNNTIVGVGFGAILTSP